MSTLLISNDVLANSGVAFGTSGARGLVNQFTPEVCAAFTYAFVAVVNEKNPIKQLAIAIDNRPSSYSMAQACAAALQAQNIEAIYYGVIPTPALAYAAMRQGIPSIMVTGSHIPFDRNGLKFYRPEGEITKEDEQAISSIAVEFTGPEALPRLDADDSAATLYLDRYVKLFDNPWLTGKRIGIYEHSSAGRDLYGRLFTTLGAEVVPLDRSDEFVPIDTEAVSEDDKVKARVWSKQHNLDAVFSTDGDGDRPLVSDEYGEWLRGDILGLLCAKFLRVEALAVPVNCNTAIELCESFSKVERTKIGSPYVIGKFSDLICEYVSVAGFEANGGFLLGTDVDFNGRKLKALPTRDALLPALIVLSNSINKGISELVNELPKRFSHSNRLRDYQIEAGRDAITRICNDTTGFLNKTGIDSDVVSIELTDGLRMTLSNDDIIHIRPSGNAPELRCYSESGDEDSAKEYVEKVLSSLKEF